MYWATQKPLNRVGKPTNGVWPQVWKSAWRAIRSAAEIALRPFQYRVLRTSRWIGSACPENLAREGRTVSIHNLLRERERGRDPTVLHRLVTVRMASWTFQRKRPICGSLNVHMPNLPELISSATKKGLTVEIRPMEENMLL